MKCARDEGRVLGDERGGRWCRQVVFSTSESGKGHGGRELRAVEGVSDEMCEVGNEWDVPDAGDMW